MGALERIGVRARVVVVSVAIFSVILAAIAVLLWDATARALADSAEVTARSTVMRMATQLRTQSASVVVPEEVPPVPDRLQQVWSEEGFVLASSNAAYSSRITVAIGVTPPLEQVEIVLADGLGASSSLPGNRTDNHSAAQVVAAVMRVRTDTGSVVTAIAVEPAHVAPDAQRQLILIGSGSALISMAALVLTLFLSVRAALNPVERMRSDLERITTSKQLRPITVPPRNDEIARLGVTLNDVLRRLNSSEEQRAAFVSDAGHELRSPLATIALSLEQLRADPEPERRAMIASRAEGEVRRLGALVDDLLALAAADEGTLVAGKEDVDLDDLVLHEVSVARAAGAEVSVSLAPTRIVGAHAQVQRIVRNLLDNARRHADSAIRVAVETSGSLAVLTVDNDGPPVPLEDRQRVFARFVRLDDARDRDRGGSGLGLSIVASLVRAYGGTVETSEAPDGWCRFLVLLPLERP